MERFDGGLLDVPGLTGAAVKTGVKPSGSLDLALVVAERPVPCAAMFTTCAAAAAPVHVCREVLDANPAIRSVVINSGNANALTGPKGEADARAMVKATDEATGGPTLVLSTGIIGVPLPIEKVAAGIDAASKQLSTDHGNAVADAILTTDTRRKTAAVRVELDGQIVTVGGIAKGSGMIHPNMATMLAVIATDATVPADRLQVVLKHAVDRSFHEISVDGDTSTNDAVILMATGGTGDWDAPLSDAAFTQLQDAVTEVARSLANQIIEDGEGMTRILDIDVRQAASVSEARAIAKSIATSSLVKTALAGGDPNWGRILAAAGNAGVDFDPSTATLTLAGIDVFRDGTPIPADAHALDAAFGSDRVAMTLALGRGSAAGHMRTTDLTHRYVEINAEYTT